MSSAVAIAVLASGRGSNFEAIADAVSARRLEAEIAVVISDRPDAAVLDRARVRGIAAEAIPLPGRGPAARDEQERRIRERLERSGVRFIVFAGYMRIVSDGLLAPFRSERGYYRAVNVHPSLLPAFPGTRGYQQAFEHGCSLSGVTVHLMDLGVDTGPICAQESFSITDCKSVEEVEKRGLVVEHRLYPRTLAWVLPERFSVESHGGRLRVRPN